MELSLREVRELSDIEATHHNGDTIIKVVLDVVLYLGDTIITSADDKIKMKGADLIWSNLANN